MRAAGGSGAIVTLQVPPLAPGTRAFYCRALLALRAARVPHLVGGAYALERYTGIARHTKDLDLFVRPGEVEAALRALARAGYHTEITFPHWLGKALCGGDFIDVIFGSGNGITPVDDEWFAHAVPSTVFGLRVQLGAPEELLWVKAFIQERERYDGADVAHLLLAQADRLDWPRLLRRFGPHWPVLLSHLVLFAFVYPHERGRLPGWVLQDLLGRAARELAEPVAEPVCRGTLLSREQYLVDIDQWGYAAARLHPRGPLSAEAIAHWTAAIDAAG